MDWINTAYGLILLIGGAISLITAGISLFMLIKNLVKQAKKNTKEQNWAMLMKIADAAMVTFEQAEGDKKTKAFASIKASAKAAGIDVDGFMDQLDAYIDDCIAWHNSLNGKKN